MKKSISVLAAIILAFGLASCGKNEGQETNDAAYTVQEESLQESVAVENYKEQADDAVTGESDSNTADKMAEDTSSKGSDVFLSYISLQQERPRVLQKR